MHAYRTHNCAALRASNVGETVRLSGWVHRKRDHGHLLFVDLRDHFGITQIVTDTDSAAFKTLDRIRVESVVTVEGEVVARSKETVNANLPTGEIEVRAGNVTVQSAAAELPMPVFGDQEYPEDIRLKYRFLDLRREQVHSNIILRSAVITSIRRRMIDQGFTEFQTPILTASSPEGARDYLVPSRVHPGKFYALPQSPQLFKQILMVAGLDRYFQVARCFRDEDLRADRQPEFTQLDMEMSFVEEDDVFATWERVLQETFREAMGVEVAIPFPRMSWSEAMERYGVDKPDLRFGLELADAAAWARDSEFAVFKNALAEGGRVMALCVPAAHALSRKDIEGLEELAKGSGAKGLGYWKAAAAGGSGSLARFCAGERAAALMKLLGAAEGDTCLFMAGKQALVWRVLGELRNHLG